MCIRDRFASLSTDAKLLYGILLDRISLSKKNGWIDSDGYVYIIYTIAELQELLLTMRWLRRTARQLRPDAVLAFHHRYNPFVMCSLLGTGIRIYQPLVTSYPVIVRYSEEDIKEAEKEVIEICERTKKDRVAVPLTLTPFFISSRWNLQADFSSSNWYTA